MRLSLTPLQAGFESALPAQREYISRLAVRCQTEPVSRLVFDAIP